MTKEKIKILLVDDSPVIQTLVKKIFFAIGIEVVGLKTGARTMEVLEKDDIKLVVMDIILPDADGMELISKIRKSKNSKIAMLPIIGISGNYKGYTDADFRKHNVEYNLMKPLDYDQLVALVRKYLKV